MTKQKELDSIKYDVGEIERELKLLEKSQYDLALQLDSWSISQERYDLLHEANIDRERFLYSLSEYGWIKGKIYMRSDTRWGWRILVI